jgi:D-alanyl-D-alanine carboxypeptidase
MFDDKPQVSNNPKTHRVNGAIFNPPPDLMVMCQSPGSKSGKVALRDVAAFWYLKMVEAARAQGIPLEYLSIWSGYRSKQQQTVIWERKLKSIREIRPSLTEEQAKAEARKWVAPPGSSAHETGLAIDLNLGYKYLAANIDDMKNTAAYKWLVANAAQFGYYPYSREPWHWVYNPEGGRRI